MPDHLTLDGGQLLLASEDDRIVTARLVPFGEQCRSNLGVFSVGPGVLQLPAAPASAILNDGHRREAPLGTGVLYAERADGVHASWRLDQSPAGDAALADIKAGRRRAVSVEADMVIRDGVAVSGSVFAAALVSEGAAPAFPSALLFATAADAAVENPDDPTTAHFSTMVKDPDTGEVYETETTVEETEETDPDTGETVTVRTTTDRTTITPGDPAEQDTTVTDPTPAAPLFAQVPDMLRNRAQRRASGPTSKPKGVTKGQLFAMLSASRHDPAARAALSSREVVGTVFAELEDITYDGAGGNADVMLQPQWLGEMWSGKTYVRKFVPLFGHADLTSMTMQGWRWKTKPEMDLWDGNKSEVPSSGADTEPYTARAQRIAGANDIAREYRDFNVTSFWDGYFNAMTESYARKSDAYCLTQAFGTTVVTIDGAPVTLKNYTDVAGDTVPNGVAAAAAKIVDGALHVIDSDTPAFAIVGKADYRELLLTRAEDTLAFLNLALGLEDGTINPSNFKLLPSAHPKFADGHVAVGATSAGKFHELSQVPIRVEGLDMVHGGIDPGMFGYVGFESNNPDALAYVAPHAG